MKQEDINRVRHLLDDYAEKHAPEHLRHFSDESTIQSLTKHPIMVCRVASQFDERHCQSVCEPYHGEKVDDQAVRSVNVWDYEMHPTEDEFLEDECERVVAGSHYLEDCASCQGKGRLICPTCHGQVKMSCGCNHGHVKCNTCGGTGKVDCRYCDGGHVECTSCKGTGKTRETCEHCGGRGVVTRSRTVEESYNHPIGGSRTEVRYRQVTKYYDEQCPVCHGRRTTNTGHCTRCGGRGYTDCSYCGGTGKQTCPTCQGKGNVVCHICGGTGVKTCSTCQGESPKGTVPCKECEGSGKLHHYLSIRQSLYYDDEEQIVCPDDFFDQKVAHLPWQEEADNEELLGVSATVLEGDVYHDDADVNEVLNQMLEQQAQHATPDKRLLLQGAWVTCFYAEEVCYQYQGKSYSGIILGDSLYLEDSPVTEYIENVAEQSWSKADGLGAAEALKDIEDAMKLETGDQDKLRAVWFEAKDRLEKMVKLGEDLFFWPSLVILTLLVYKFYAVINPVVSYASIVKDPLWRGYDMLPITQAVIFAVLYCAVKLIIRVMSKYQSTYGTHGITYILVGMRRIFLTATIILAVLLLLNYLGLSWLTTWMAIIVVALVKLILSIFTGLWKIVQWLFGLFT